MSYKKALLSFKSNKNGKFVNFKSNKTFIKKSFINEKF